MAVGLAARGRRQATASNEPGGPHDRRRAPNERDPEIHEAFLSLACAILCFRITRRQAQGGSPSRGNGTEGCASVLSPERLLAAGTVSRPTRRLAGRRRPGCHAL